MSLIQTPPPDRQAIQTVLSTAADTEVIRKAIAYERERAGQVFFVHNRIEGLPAVEQKLRMLFPEASLAVAHSQMQAGQLEEILLGFFQGSYHILLSTNIVENGLDIPNANTIIVHNAHCFGLSELHQLRGRVGRSHRKGFCYLLCPPEEVLTPEAKKRLGVIEAFSELGAGLKVALKDLEIRGAGHLLSAEQSGFISEMGFETYHRLLDETVEKIKESPKYKPLFESAVGAGKAFAPKPLTKWCVVEHEDALFIPATYVEEEGERLRIYSVLSRLQNPQEMHDYFRQLTDRFGPLPSEMKKIATSLKMRWLGTACGFEKLTYKQQTLCCYFPAAFSGYFSTARFQRILHFVQGHATHCRLVEKEKQGYLRIAPILDEEQVISSLEAMASDGGAFTG